MKKKLKLKLKQEKQKLIRLVAVKDNRELKQKLFRFTTFNYLYFTKFLTKSQFYVNYKFFQYFNYKYEIIYYTNLGS